MYPRLTIDVNKVKENTKIVADACAKEGIDILAVTKVYCGIPEVAQASIDGGAKLLADSRIENLKKMAHLGVPRLLLRLPMISQVDDVVKHAQISMNSELSTLHALNKAAEAIDTIHKIVLMVDLGDLREGIMPDDVDNTVKEILAMKNIELYGLGVNLTCYGGIVPNEVNLGQLADIANHIESTYNHSLTMISGGNSSSFYLLEQGRMPDKINNLRMGEIIVLGRETAYGDQVMGMHDDCFILEAEIIEMKEKPSVPIGEIGMDAFGNKPTFVDRGMMIRGILGVGKQDVDPSGLTPVDKRVKIVGASSDHLIIDLTEMQDEVKVGSILTFTLDYGTILELSTSPYIRKNLV